MSAPPPYHHEQQPPPPSYAPLPPDAAAHGPGNAAARFFGGNPLWVLLRLALLSVGVGLVLSAFGIRPWNVLYYIRDLADFAILNVRHIAGTAWGYFLVGAVVVFPIWLLTRLLGSGRR